MRLAFVVLATIFFCPAVRAELDKIENIEISFGWSVKFPPGNFVRSDRNPQQWNLQFIDSEKGLVTVPIATPLQKMLEDLVAHPEGPWGFNSKDYEHRGDVDSITHGKFAGPIEVSVNSDGTLRSVRGHFASTYAPDGSPTGGEVVRAEIFRTTRGADGGAPQHYVQVYKGIPSDGGGMKVAKRPANDVKDFKQAGDALRRELFKKILGDICRRIDDEIGTDEEGPQK